MSRAPRALVPWLVAAVALPLLAHRALGRAVDERLVPALEQATGEPVAIDSVEVSLLGAVRIRGLALGDLLSVGSLEARVGLSSLASGRVRADEIVIESPRANIRGGGMRLRKVARRFASRRSRAGATARRDSDSGGRWRRWPHIRLDGGFLRLDVGDRGVALVNELQVHPTERGLRIIAGSGAYHGRAAGVTVIAGIGRSAVDIDLSTATVTRAIGSGGHIEWRSRGIAARDLEVSFGIEGTGSLTARARLGGGRIRARLRGTAVELALSDVSSETMSKLLPSGELHGGRVGGRLSIARSRDHAGQSLSLSGSVQLRNVRGTLPWLYAGELDLSSELGGTATISRRQDSSDAEAPPTRTLELDELELRRDDLVASLSGTLSSTGDLSGATGELALRVPETDCAALLASLPGGLVGPLRGMRLAGRIAAAGELRIGQPGSRPVELELAIDPDRCRVGADAPTAAADKLASSYAHQLPGGRTVVLTSGSDGYTSLRALPSYVAAAFITAEDGRFYQHSGFDIRQIESSIAKDLEVGSFARGGSTISQQLAKNLFLGRERTLGRKLQEAVLAWRLEAVLSKREILERYLNVIQLGEETYGIEAAAREWFAKSARKLAPREAAFLASLTRAPSSTTRAIRENGGITPVMVRRVEHILKSMSQVGAIDAHTLARERNRQLVLAPVVAAR